MIETLILLIFLNITLKTLKYDHTEKYLLSKMTIPKSIFYVSVYYRYLSKLMLKPFPVLQKLRLNYLNNRIAKQI